MKGVRRYSTASKFIASHDPFTVTTYARPPIVLARGQGSYLWDTDNKRYVDFTAGIAVTGLGHSHPMVSKIIAEQASTLMHSSNLYYNEWTPRLSKALVEETKNSGGFPLASRTFLANSGSEANEAALKFARKYGKRVESTTNKYEIVSFKGSFHGRTFGALSATVNQKYQAPFEPMVPGYKYGTLNDVNAIESLVTDKTCAVIIEPIQGEGGVNVASPEFLKALRQRTSQVDALLIYDEIQCGLSRTGKLWAHQWSPAECTPDILTTAKALGNGFPIGATIIAEHVERVLKVGDHGTTYGGNPLASRVGLSVLAELVKPELQNGVLAKSEIIKQRATQWKEKFPEIVTEVRGKGLLLGIQLTQDPTPIVNKARDLGLLVITCGTNTLRLVPALNIPDEVLNEGLDILGSAIEQTR